MQGKMHMICVDIRMNTYVYALKGLKV